MRSFWRWFLCGAVLLWALPCSASLGSCTSSQLFTELSTDPQSLGYAAAYGGPITAGSGGNDAAVTDALNLVRSGVAYQLNKGVVATTLLLQQMVKADLIALLSGTPPKMPILQLYMTQASLDTSVQNMQDVFLDLFPAGTVSRQNLVAFFKRQGARAEVLCGVGTVMTSTDVSCAIRGAC